MRIVVCDDSDRSAELVAREILSALADDPSLVLGLATGSTPIGVYQRLAAAHRDETASFAGVSTFNLDEYLEISADHPMSYRSFMREHLFDHVDLAVDRVHFPPTTGPGLRARCREFEERIRSVGGIDIQLLGIGRNGHIGFNEPTCSLASRTRVVSLSQRTLADNARFFEPGQQPPPMATTMGIGTILEARRILLQASGEAKAEAIRAAIEGPLTSSCPASALQQHTDVTIFLDPAAASLLSRRDDYARARQNERELDRRGWL